MPYIFEYIIQVDGIFISIIFLFLVSKNVFSFKLCFNFSFNFFLLFLNLIFFNKLYGPTLAPYSTTFDLQENLAFHF